MAKTHPPAKTSDERMIEDRAHEKPREIDDFGLRESPKF